MNSTEMAMVDAQPSVIQSGIHGDIIPLQQTYNARYINPYLSGAIIISAYETKPDGGIPYWMTGIHVQTCNNNQITAPQPALKSTMTHIVRPISQVGQSPALQAPTSGIFTGVKDEC